MSDNALIVDRVVGSRLSIRHAARMILEHLDQLAPHEIEASGWTQAEIKSLERLAACEIAGIPYGEWPSAGGNDV